VLLAKGVTAVADMGTEMADWTPSAAQAMPGG
jgi:hypothetical protein